MTTPIITAVGLSTRAGTLPLLVDGDANVGWAPQPTRLTSFTDTFTDTGGNPNAGKNFAFLQFDFGEPTRIPLMLIQTQGAFALGDCMMIASDLPATTTAQAVQSGDVILGMFPRATMTLGQVLSTFAKKNNISKRYLRMCFHATGALMTPTGTDTPDGGTATNAMWYDTGEGEWPLPATYSKIIVEGWGAGASGGAPANANDGGDTHIGIDSKFVLHCLGGHKATTNANSGGTPAQGGGSSGGNVQNTTGGNGELPSSFNASTGFSGKGGDSPNGGTGGAAVFNDGNWFLLGNPGNGPGGGGSGRNIFTSVAGGTCFKYPGGGAGGYSRHEIFPGDLDPFTSIPYFIGNGGANTIGDGIGAQGRAKFSWTP